MVLEEMTVLELDDFYYVRYAEGANLQELKRIRIVQEAKIQKLPEAERLKIQLQIRERYQKTLLSPSAQSFLHSKRT